MTHRAGPASRASPPAHSLVASRFTPPGTASSSPTTSPRTSTSRPATAAPPWTPTPSRSRPGPRPRRRGPRPARARARARQDHRPARAARASEQVLQPDDPRITGPVTLRGPIPDAPRRHRRGRRDHPLPRRPRRPDRGRRCSRCWATPTTRAPRSRRCWPAPTSRRRSPTRSRASPTACRHEVRDADRVDRADLRDVPFTTIDPETARDFDDAVAIEIAAERRHAPVGRGRRRLALRARGVAARRRGAAGAAAASTCPTARSRCCPSRCRRASARWSPRRIGWRWWCASISTGTAQPVATRLLRGGDSFARAARLPGRGGGAGRRHARQAEEVRAVPARRCARWIRWRGRCAWPRLARGALDFDLPEPFVELDHDDPRLVRAIRKSRRDPGERQAYSMIEEFMLAANEAVARQLPRARRGHPLAHPRRARSRAPGGVRGRWRENYGIAIDVDEARTPARASSGCSTG